jgi:hypothetical protein
MYVVNTRVAENGRRLVKLREFYGRVIAHGIAPEPPEFTVQSMERMMKDKDFFVASRGGTVKGDPKAQESAQVADPTGEQDETPSEAPDDM